MGRSVRISEDDLRPVFEVADEVMARHPPDYVEHQRKALENLRRALSRLDRIPKSKPPAEPKLRWNGYPKSRKPSKEEKRDHREHVRAACVDRMEQAGGECECGCGVRVFDDDKTAVFPEARGEMDHFWGKAKAPETVETCWFLRPGCHGLKTRNLPDAATWLRKFIAHCERYGYNQQRAKAEARLRFVETRAALPAAPRVRP